MTPKDTNNDGAVFGGAILSLMDQAAYIEAMRQASHLYLTLSFDKIVFKNPVFSGDVLSVSSYTEKIGRTSLTVIVEVFALRQRTGEEVRVALPTRVTYVAVDKENKPTPIERT